MINSIKKNDIIQDSDENLKFQIQLNKQIEEIENLIIAGNRFKDDEWYIGYGKYKNYTRKGEAYNTIDFKIFKEIRIRNVFKLYIIYCFDEKMNSYSTVKRKYQELYSFYKYLKNLLINIELLEEVNSIIFSMYLNEILNRKGKKYSSTSLKVKSKTIRDLYVIGEKKRWIDSGNTESFIDLVETIILSSPRVERGVSKKSTKVIYSEETIKTIILKALDYEDYITKNAIILMSQLGFRIGELLELKRDCIKEIDGKAYIEYSTTKTKKGKVEELNPANELVVNAVNELLAKTKDVARSSNIDKLFIYQVGEKKYLYRREGINKKLKKFIEENDIRENGELVHITSHYFRHFFVSKAWQQGMPFQYIASIIGHSSLEMTSTYLYTQEEKMREMFVEKIVEKDLNFEGNAKERVQETIKKNNFFMNKSKRDYSNNGGYENSIFIEWILYISSFK